MVPRAMTRASVSAPLGFAPVGRRDLFLQEGAGGRRQALDTHVLSSFFFAAGNRTLFRINR